MTSKLSLFSRFVADMHGVCREAETDVAQFGLERLRPILGFDCAWYGWTRQHNDRTTVHASSTIDLPASFASFWSTMENQDLVAQALRRDRGKVVLYDRHQTSQTDGMIDLSERYSIKRWASAVYNRPNRATTFFASVYRTNPHDQPWTNEDLELLQCAVDHIFLAAQASVGRASREGERRWTTLIVDPAGFAHLGLANSRTLLRTVWPGWQGERLPKPLRQITNTPGTHTLESQGIVVSCEKDRHAGTQSELIRLKLSMLSQVDRLSSREQQVARLLASGATHKMAAQALGSAPTTVRNQTQAIYDKLGIHSRAELIDLVLREGGATPA
ncbi:MAG: LuxR C-terminal-related transcriptional regulator [Mesorhizobium sp.]